MINFNNLKAALVSKFNGTYNLFYQHHKIYINY